MLLTKLITAARQRRNLASFRSCGICQQLLNIEFAMLDGKIPRETLTGIRLAGGGYRELRIEGILPKYGTFTAYDPERDRVIEIRLAEIQAVELPCEEHDRVYGNDPKPTDVIRLVPTTCGKESESRRKEVCLFCHIFQFTMFPFRPSLA